MGFETSMQENELPPGAAVSRRDCLTRAAAAAKKAFAISTNASCHAMEALFRSLRRPLKPFFASCETRDACSRRTSS